MATTQEAYRPDSDDHETNGKIARIAANSRLFFSTWGRKHEREIDDTEFLDDHPAQSIDVPVVPEMVPEDGTVEEFAERIASVVAMDFKENPEAAGRMFAALDEVYAYEGGNGRTFLEVLVEDYLSKGKGVVVLLAHIDKGLTDVPRMTGILRSKILHRYGDKYLTSVGEVASKTVTYEKIHGIETPDVLSVLGKAFYVGPTTGSIDEILALSGMSWEEYEEVARYLNDKATMPIAHELRTRKPDELGEVEPGSVVVFSGPGKRADLKRDDNGNVISVDISPVKTNSARLISFGSAAWPVSIARDRIKLGPIVELNKQRDGDKEQRALGYLSQIEDCMDIVAQLTDEIFGEGPIPRRATTYHRTTPRD